MEQSHNKKCHRNNYKQNGMHDYESFFILNHATCSITSNFTFTFSPKGAQNSFFIARLRRRSDSALLQQHDLKDHIPVIRASQLRLPINYTLFISKCI
jgi:hypothetical protein